MLDCDILLNGEGIIPSCSGVFCAEVQPEFNLACRNLKPKHWPTYNNNKINN